MELFILIVCLLIFAETSILVFKKRSRVRSGKRKIYIDTSALIDGRILNITRSGFLDGDIIVLKSVLRELQLLADGKDPEKRVRARAGLETVLELERVVNINTMVFDDGEGRKKVDEELLRFARENKGAVLTIDYNLIKVAEAENIETLNVNELALAVRTEFLPGEKMQVAIKEKGANRGQGVGHLPDGTMVIVDKAASEVGKTINVEFVRFHETASGKIVFAKIAKNQIIKENKQ